MEPRSFGKAVRRGRCRGPGDGYYEWSGAEGRKVPFFVQAADKGLFALAGLWEHWMGADGSELETATLMTIAPNAELATIHDRMPVIIAPEDYETWLTGETEDAAKLIRPAPDGSFVMEPTAIGRAPAPRPPPKKPDQMSLL